MLRSPHRALTNKFGAELEGLVRSASVEEAKLQLNAGNLVLRGGVDEVKAGKKMVIELIEKLVREIYLTKPIYS